MSYTYRFVQQGQLYTDETSGVGAHRLDRAYALIDLQPHGWRKARNKKNPKDAEVLAHEAERVKKSPQYS